MPVVKRLYILTPNFSSGAVLFYSSFFTSIWIWLYVLASFLVKTAEYLSTGVSIFRRILNIEQKHVFISLGWVAILFVSLGFLLGLAFYK